MEPIRLTFQLPLKSYRIHQVHLARRLNPQKSYSLISGREYKGSGWGGIILEPPGSYISTDFLRLCPFPSSREEVGYRDPLESRFFKFSSK